MGLSEALPLERAYRWERERADQPFLTQPLAGGVVREWTWAQAMDEARRMAAWLEAQGWEPGARVAIMAKNCAWWVMADLAIWMAGYVSVPIYPSLVSETVRQILEHSESRACFIGAVDDPSMKKGIPAGMKGVSFPVAGETGLASWSEIVAATAPLVGQPVRGAEELATIIYTSGTTGIPKGVMHRFSAFAIAAQAFTAEVKGTAGERALSYLPLAHVAERALIEGTAIYTGSRLFFVESIETFLDDLRRARPTVFFSVPRLWVKFQQGVFAKKPKEKLERLCRIPLLGRYVKRKILTQLGLGSVRHAACGAAPMPPEVLTWYRDLGLELLEGYGMTENFAFSHGSRVGRGRVGYVGHPFDGVDVRLSESGEVLVKSPTNMMGYFKEPALTAEAFTEDGFLRTGDLGALDEDGRLRITGRAKELFKTSKGKYVSPAVVENSLGAHARIEASCVTGVGFPQPFAIAILPPGEWQRCSEPAARDELTQSLAAHLDAVNATLSAHEQLDFLVLVPEAWTVESGFITPTLKVKRAVIEERYAPFFETWARERRPVVWHGTQA